MKYLTLLVILLPCAVSAGEKDHSRVIKALKNAAETTDVPYRLIASICFVESSYRPGIIRKDDGNSPSYGLCQIKEDTARDMGFKGPVKDLLNPFINAVYAAKYLRYQLDRYDGDWVRALSAYNSGSSKSEIKNQTYVNRVLLMAVKL